MSLRKSILTTRRGTINYPTYVPVTTFGDKYPLDKLVQPYLPRLAQAVMVSFHYARQMTRPPLIPLFLDSGGFASLLSNSTIEESERLGVLRIQNEEGHQILHPRDVLELQEELADVAFTLDFPIPPSMARKDALIRQRLTITNSIWALENRRRKDLLLFASIQAWDAESAKSCARAYRGCGFDGVAIGGLVPRAQDYDLVLSIVEAVRDEIPDLPLHVFGLGKPSFIEELFEAGVDSVDSSSYVQLAADGRLWSHPKLKLSNASPTDRLHLAVCNLAAATGRTLPLSAAKMVFSTHNLFRRTGS